MDALALDPDGYDGTYKLVGGQLSLDLVNTLAWRGTAREHEWFHSPGNVTAWAVESGLIDPSTRRALDEDKEQRPEAGAAELSAVHDLREIVGDALAPLARGNRPPPSSVARLDHQVQLACGRRRLHPDSLHWTWVTPTTLVELMAPVLWNAGEVLTDVDRRRLGHCPTCGWLFHDTTRNRSRRWCDMQDCGSRDKALRYYHRTRSIAGTRPDQDHR